MGEPSSFNYNKDDFVEIEDEMFEDENEEKNMSRKGKGDRSSCQNIWSKERLAQINECQRKLFGNEQPKQEYNLNDNSQQIIFDHYISINKDFKKAAKNYMKLENKNKRNADVFLDFLSLNKIFFNKILILECSY